MAACSCTGLLGRQSLLSIDLKILSRWPTVPVSSALHTSTMLRHVAKVGSTFLNWDKKHQYMVVCGVWVGTVGGWVAERGCGENGDRVAYIARTRPSRYLVEKALQTPWSAKVGAMYVCGFVPMEHVRFYNPTITSVRLNPCTFFFFFFLLNTADCSPMSKNKAIASFTLGRRRDGRLQRKGQHKRPKHLLLEPSSQKAAIPTRRHLYFEGYHLPSRVAQITISTAYYKTDSTSASTHP